MAGRQIKVMVVITIEEDVQPVWFEAARTNTARSLDGINNDTRSALVQSHVGHVRITGVEHVYDR